MLSQNGDNLVCILALLQSDSISLLALWLIFVEPDLQRLKGLLKDQLLDFV